MGLLPPSHTTRSGFRRASFGSLSLIGGVIAGLLVGVPQLHRSMTASQTPVRLTCVQLLQNGIPSESSIIVLTDAAVHPPGKIEPGQLDGENAVSPALATMSKILADPRAEKLVDRLVRGDVLPRGVPKRGDFQPLKLSMGRQTAEVAKTEVQKDGLLTVHVTEDRTNQWVSKAANWFEFELPEKLSAQTHVPAYTLHPASLIDSRRNALIWVGGGSLATVLGLILCGSAPIGWWILLSPLGALLGLPGMPIRQGRGNKLTWLLSIVIGLGSIAGAYHLCFQIGGLGQSNGQWWLQAAGFLAGCFGVAAILGTFLSIRASRQNRTGIDALSNFGPATSKRASKRQQTRTSEVNKPVQLQSMIAKSEYTRRYIDPKLSVAIEVDTPAGTTSQTKSLEKLEFDAPLIIEFCAGEHTCAGTVQVGARSLMMATSYEIDDHLSFRMTSVLEDGHVVVTTDGRDERFASPLDADAATIRVFETTKAAKLVTKHLEEAAAISEKRKTTLTTLDSCEWRDLIHYSERCLADALHHAHIEKWDIANAHYGRFNFPPAEVPIPAMA